MKNIAYFFIAAIGIVVTLIFGKALLIPFIFHSLYDYFLFLDFIPGIWVGGIITLLTALYIAKNSITEHLGASPFKNKK